MQLKSRCLILCSILATSILGACGDTILTAPQPIILTDTVSKTIHDTLPPVHDTTVKHDTLTLPPVIKHDTIVKHDTVTKHDTIYVDVPVPTAPPPAATTQPVPTITLVSRNPCNIGSPGNGCQIDPAVANLFVTVKSSTHGSFVYRMFNVNATPSVTVIQNDSGTGYFRWNIGIDNLNANALLQICLADYSTICLNISPNLSDYKP